MTDLESPPSSTSNRRVTATRAERWRLFALLLAAMIAVVGVRLLPLWRSNPTSLYRGSDGRQHVLLGDSDSYLWLRLARNKLDHGNPCDAVVDGVCRDNHAYAPLGAEMRYARSLHVEAIAALHRLITTVVPEQPLPAASFLVPVIVGAFGVLAAFCLGARLAGPIGGVWAAVLGGLHPVFLERSIGSDNDVWNVVMPLYLIWAGIAALQATSRARAIVLAGLAVLVGALHAQIWGGWQLAFSVLLVGSLVCAASRALIAIRLRRAPWRDHLCQRATMVAIVLLVGPEVVAILTGSQLPNWNTLAGFAGRLVRTLVRVPDNQAPPLVHWPDMLSTVGELRQPFLVGVRDNLGPFFLFGGWLGGWILLVQGRRLPRWRAAIGVAGAVVGGYLLLLADVDRRTVMICLAAPIAVVWALDVFIAVEFTTAAMAGLIILIWQATVLFLAYDSLRYTMLLVPALAIGSAVVIGRLQQSVDHRLARLPRWQGRSRVVVLIAFAVACALPVQRGAAFALRYMTAIEAAWWDTLTTIRDSTPPDTIINTWWDNGYWAEYVADRRVSGDGGSLTTQLHYWLARALFTADEDEALGLLRMLDCGSDATPLPEGRAGAYGKLVAHGVDPAFAPTLIGELAKRDRDGAAALLAARSLSSDAIADILSSTHCSPPPALLVLSDKLGRTIDWPYLATWNFAEVETRKHLRRLKEEQALAALTQRFELPVEAAHDLLDRVGQMPQPDVISKKIVYVTYSWIPCTAQSDGRFLCSVFQPLPSGQMLDWILVRIDDPAESRLLLRKSADGATDRETRPAMVLIAGETGIAAFPVSEPWSADVAILFDAVERRALVGTPDILRSTYTQLMFLDGRYSRYFKKAQQRTGRNRQRVVTWSIAWNG